MIARKLILLPAMAIAVVGWPFMVAGQTAGKSTPQGKAAFASCAGCHSIDPKNPSTLAPTLAGVTGRKAGTYPGFKYSTALVNSGIVWDKASLDKWLTRPTAAVPGTRMMVSVSDAKKRKLLIEYLATLRARE